MVGVEAAEAAFDGAGEFLGVGGGVAVAWVGPLGSEYVVVVGDAIEGASEYGFAVAVAFVGVEEVYAEIRGNGG